MTRNDKLQVDEDDLGPELDYYVLKTQDVIDLISHYVSNHLMNYFEQNCKSRLYNPISNEFVEPRFDMPDYLL